jgi:hypothetical protein
MVELAISRISRPNQPHENISVPTELIKRDSCSPIPLSGPLSREHPTENAARPVVLPPRLNR